MGVAVAPPTLLAASERKICNLCHRAAEPLAPAGELPLESVRRQTGEGPGLVLHNVPGSENPALHLTKSRPELEATVGHCAPTAVAFGTFESDGETPAEGRMTPAHPMISSS